MLRQTIPWLKAVRAAWLRQQKIQQLYILEAMHSPKPQEMKIQILAELNNEQAPKISAFAQLQAHAAAQQAAS